MEMINHTTNTNGEIFLCPLCLSKRNYSIKEFKINDLKKLWTNSFGFDPFVDYKEKSEEIIKLCCANCGIYFFSPQFYGGSSFYDKLSAFPWYYESDKWEFDKTIELINMYHPKTLLEVGSGGGFFLEKVKNAIEYTEGVEINKQAVEKCVLKGINVSSKKISEINKKFDMVVSFQVFEHVDNISEILKDTLGLLAPGGLLVVSVPNPDSYLKDLDTCLLDLPPHHSLGLTKKTFDFISENNNLKILNYYLEPLRFVHYHAFLNGVVDKDKLLVRRSIKSTIKNKLRKLIISLRAPLSYVSDREKIIGPTHLVVYQKQ